MRCLRLSILAIGLIACEETVLDDGTALPPPAPTLPVGMSIPAYYSAAHARLCALLDECCTSTEALFITSCEDRLAWYEGQARRREELVASGRARWDGAAAQACADGLDGRTCQDLVREDYILAACPDAFIYLDAPPNPCRDYPCAVGSWCRADGDSHECLPDLAEGASCDDEPVACGEQLRCRRPIRVNGRFCEPSLCDGDSSTDARTVLTEFYRGLSSGGNTRTVQCALPPDGFFECSCVVDGVASSCKTSQIYREGIDFSNYICC